MPSKQAVSVIIPTLNEAANIAKLLIRIDRSLQHAGFLYEIIVVDDHSRDDTVAVANAAQEHLGYPLRILMKQGRPGKSYSLMEGFAAARYNTLVMIDGDLQYPPEEIPAMMRMLDHGDIIVADRRSSYAQTNHLRGKLSSRFDAVVGKRLFGINADLQSGLKVFSRSLYQRIDVHPGRWSFDIELLTRAKHQGYTISNLPITYQARLGGESKVQPTRVGMELMAAALRLRTVLTLLSLMHLLMRYGVLPRSEQFVATTHRIALREAQDNQSDIDERDRAYYARWLQEEAGLRDPSQVKASREDYVSRAMQPVRFYGKTTYPFTPLATRLSAIQTFTRGQIITFVSMFVIFIGGVIFFTLPTIVGLLSVIVLGYFKKFIDTLRMTAQSLDSTIEEHIGDDIVLSLSDSSWPSYTILCPLYKEVEIAPQFVSAMTALNYPVSKLQILFLTEEHDAATRAALLHMELPEHFVVVTVPDGQPQTKPRACNYGLMQATGDYIVIYDAEDIPDPLQLKKAVLTFANHTPNLACVQAKLNFYNPLQNILTRWFTIEYTLWFDLTLPAMQRARMSLPLGGTSNHFRTAILRKLSGWDPFNVTEDCDLGLRLAQHHLQTVVLDSTTMEEANSRPKNWVRQRSRWIKGYLQTYLVHMRQPTRYLLKGRWREFLSLQFIIGGAPATFFVNPLMWIMLAIYIGLRPLVVDTYEMLYPAPLFYAGVLCFVFGNFLYIYSALLACAKRKQYRLMIWVFTLPIYWMMMSIAAGVAFFQLLVKPHYWEKTQHGLHLRLRKKTKVVPFSSQPLLSDETPVPVSVSPFEISDIRTNHFE